VSAVELVEAKRRTIRGQGACPLQDEPDCEKRSAERSGVVWNHMESTAIPFAITLKRAMLSDSSMVSKGVAK